MSISNRKVVIVGAGHVGSHVGYALISQSLADEIVYIDSDRAKAVAQALDLTDVPKPRRREPSAGVRRRGRERAKVLREPSG